LVSVLFADLVGFTSLSEHRDPEEVRELLSGYFERSRAVVERYGGTVEKFIGDAVMAVWGTPVAREDDAERSVRAALSLVAAVAALGEEVGMPELRVRAGVLTGNAAVEVGAVGEGMVLGDTVNTASRLQSIAEPGTVLVDDVTRRASEAAVAYEDAGQHEVKGREQPVRAWRALQVVGGAGGARRGVGVEAPFVGRARELATIVEAGEASAGEGSARLIAVVGEAGTGKSRLLWEFFKYIDGIEDVRWWHQGRCLSYGEGVAFWALAEMIRARVGISEEDPPEIAREKLRAAVLEYVSDERERRLVEPRLAHLLRLEERPGADRADLFSGWRLFFERLADIRPVTLVFEDLQWADSGLLEFIDYLLEWSAGYPIFILALGRPELSARRPEWQPLRLEPLPATVLAELLDGLAPGLPDELVAEIVTRSEGIPLYAVETIRMLRDRGVLVIEGDRYAVIGEVSELDVPETLHALVASRLDGLSPEERGLLQDASVLGQSFGAAAAAAVSGRPEAEIGGVLDALVAKQVLGRDDDPRSPERGQYVFLQALVRTVAYGTLSRRKRKSLHLAAARHLEATWPGEPADIAEVLADHYLQSIAADPEAEDVVELRAGASERLASAGRAAASLALGTEADRYFEQAAELTAEEAERASLFEAGGNALFRAGELEAAEHRLRQAAELHRLSGRPTGGRSSVSLAMVLRRRGRLEDALAVLEPFRSGDAEPDVVLRAHARAELATALAFAGEIEASVPLFDDALTVLQEQQAWPELAEALVGQATRLLYTRRLREGEAVLGLAISLADELDLPAVGLRARYNLAAAPLEAERLEETVQIVDEALPLARMRGDRYWETSLLLQKLAPLVILGRWDEALTVNSALPSGEPDQLSLFAAAALIEVAAAREDRELLDRCQAVAEHPFDLSVPEQASSIEIIHGWLALDRERPDDALTAVRHAFLRPALAGETIVGAYHVAVRAAIALEDVTAMLELREFVAALPPARATPILRAGAARLTAEIAFRESGAAAALEHEDEAIALLRSIGALPMLAEALLERHRRQTDADALAEARTILKQLGATAWVARIAEPSSGVIV
jgi:class 3 adenylate cyclase/tetratricopeptide (TPR) repeat protein